MSNDDRDPSTAVEKAIANLKATDKKSPDSSIYRVIEEIEHLIISLEERIAHVKQRLEDFDHHTVRGYNRFFGETEGKQ